MQFGVVIFPTDYSIAIAELARYYWHTLDPFIALSVASRPFVETR